MRYGSKMSRHEVANQDGAVFREREASRSLVHGEVLEELVKVITADFDHARVKVPLLRLGATLQGRLLERDSKTAAHGEFPKPEEVNGGRFRRPSEGERDGQRPPGASETHFLRTSPNSSAGTTPTTRNLSLDSLKAASTNGKFRFTPAPPPAAAWFSSMLRIASTSQCARRSSVAGCWNTGRSGPSLTTARRYERKNVIAFLSRM